jgi:hypothetical protein
VVVDAASGKPRGMLRGGLQVFTGRPYRAPSTGACRSRPPVKAPSWTGVRDASAFGPRSPQLIRPMIPELDDSLTGSGEPAAIRETQLSQPAFAPPAVLSATVPESLACLAVSASTGRLP